ncbi:hypothetical protein SAMN05421823_101537 [Catalinimonas alkaloidigena]|uniref:Uncharacterized protein n=1 Tax=Catalinimonas alkaloidigena TaxID=1075417 RepID=A0A1G8Y108_9BACT|nr:hypothetical protein [Catalinimonas alkaloidigena]SDJ96472.1 hypothetical protein SAMN05421823_101537 [Catalinimonas alkaloidigena]
MKKTAVSLLTALALLSACDPETQSTPDVAESLDQAAVETPKLSNEVLRDLLQSIPSPLETSMLIKESGAQYEKGYLNSVDNKSNYNTNARKALNLGIYGADLGYTNLYSRSQDGIYYMNAVRDMAEGLQIGQFFDFELIRRLATNTTNLDSLLLITTQNFQQINTHLQDQNRTNLSVLILAGGWLEAQHLMNQVVQDHPDQEALKERIGEQKIVLERIMLVLDSYSQDPSIGPLAADMKQLKGIFDEVEIVHTYEESVMEEVDGIMMMVDKSTSTVYITSEQLERIAKTTEQIRNKIIES